MSDRLIVVRDTERPPRYKIILNPVSLGGGAMEGTPLTWPTARRACDPEAYAYLARATFTDWCARNGW
jgi:hypothetical protein